MKAETEHKIVLDYEDEARASLGTLNDDMQSEIKVTLNWWGYLLHLLRGNWHTKREMIARCKERKSEYELPTGVKPHHIKNIKLIVKDK